MQRLATILLIVLFWLPLQLWTRYTPLVEQLQDESYAARAMWEGILAAEPPSDAILVSNDRNEIVPLFYLQTVENRARGNTGLFPAARPRRPLCRHWDDGADCIWMPRASVQPNQPVYLIKPMEGLEARFALAPATPPLVQVTGPAAAEPAIAADLVYGPLRLLGYDMQPAGTG